MFDRFLAIVGYTDYGLIPNLLAGKSDRINELWGIKVLMSNSCHVIYISQNVFKRYRGSPDSTNFGSQDNRVIRKIVLIGD